MICVGRPTQANVTTATRDKRREAGNEELYRGKLLTARAEDPFFLVRCIAANSSAFLLDKRLIYTYTPAVSEKFPHTSSASL